MGNGVFKQPELQALDSGKRKRQKPARVNFPTVTQVKARVSAAYNVAVKSLLATHFTKAPPKSELKNFAALIKAFVRANRRGPNGTEFQAITSKFRRKYPKSTLSKYLRTSGTANWLKVTKLWMTGRGKIMVKFAFSRSQLQKHVLSRISSMKSKLVKAATVLVNPAKRSNSVDVGGAMTLLPVGVSASFTKRFIANIAGQTNRKKLYLKASYNSPKIYFTSTLPIKRVKTRVNLQG